VAADQPWWIRVLLRAASHRATDAELGDVVEEYVAAHRSPLWFAGQIISIVGRRRRSRLTLSERGTEMLSNVRNDIRHALRTLRRNPGFAVAAIVPIALGIGINTGIFSIVNSAAWRALPVPDSDRLVSVYQEFRGGPRRTFYGARTLFSLPEYRAYRDDTQTLSGVMAYSRVWTVTLGGPSPREIDGILVTCNYFDVLGVPAAIGTGFTTANCGTSEASPVVVLSHALWKGTFGGDPRILEKPIVLGGRQVTVVGVAPLGFDGIDMAKSSFFAPTAMAAGLRPDQDLQENAQVSWLTLIGRRRNGVDIAQVRAELAVVASRIDRQQPGRTTSLIVEPAAALSLPGPRQAVLRGTSVVMAAFGLVLLMATANVANMLLARATGRTREIAIRLSVGATRGRLVQQLLTESAIIAVAGAACGTLLFWWSFRALIPWLLGSFPGAEAIRIDATPDATVFWLALGLAAATALLFGLVPALQASRGDIHAVSKPDGADAKGGRGWLRGALIGAQVALCTVLLIPAGLLSRALYAAHTFDPGFDHRNVAAISIDLRGPQYDNGNAALFSELWRERVSALPGVERLALASRIPLSSGRSQTTIRIDDRDERHVVDINAVSPEFFSLLDIPLVRGRLFTNGESDATLVTESTARRYWPGQDAIGRTIAIDGQRRQIVGIVRDAQLSQAQDAISNYVYLPATTSAQRGISVLARTRTAVGDLAAAIRAETSRMDAGLVVNVQPLSANLGLLQTLSQLAAGVAGVLSLLALSLATVGIYGVVSYVVSRRRREVGVRMALGACARDVQRLFLGQTLRPVTIGMSIGIAGAAAGARILQSVLFGVSPYDPLAFIGAPLIMLAIAATAALVPTRRAMRVNPMSVLRE
jgi:predicted permease